MAGDLETQVVGIAYNGAVTTLKVLAEIIKMLLDGRNRQVTGEQSLKDLNLQGKKLESINLSQDDIKEFRKQLNQYNVDFSVMKDKAAGHSIVFFKGQDIDRVYTSLEKCLQNIMLSSDSKKLAQQIMKDAMDKSKEQAENLGDKTHHNDRGERN